MNGEQLKKKMKSDGYIYGTHIVAFENAMVTQWYAEKVDFAFICQEHMPLTREQTSTLCTLFKSYDVSPMVRIPYPDKNLAVVAVEGGAEGVVVPYVESVSQIEDIISALKYRPIKGKYLDDMLAGQKQPTQKLVDYMANLNKDLYVVAGIESVPAMENLDEFLDCEDVYAIFLGPHDITCSMGIPGEYDNPLFIEKVCDTIRRCRAAGKPVGAHVDYSLERCKPFLEAGANYILNSANVTKAIPSLEADFEMIRQTYEK